MCKLSIIRALKFILNSDYLDLTINPATAHYGLRFYTDFNRIEALNEMPQLIVNNNLIDLTANIITPVGYPSRFNNLDRETILPVSDIVAVALVVKPDKLDQFLNQLIMIYEPIPLPCDSKDDNNRQLAELFMWAKGTKRFDIGIDAIDRSNNPASGKVIVGDEELIWVQGTATDVPPTFYIVLMNKIPFVCPIG